MVAHQVIGAIRHLSVDVVELRCDYLQLLVGGGLEVDICHLQEEQRLVGSLVVTLLSVLPLAVAALALVAVA